MQMILDSMAVARLIKLARDDSITDTLRERLIERTYSSRGDVVKPDSVTWQEYAKLDKDPPALARLIECPWCLGVWSAGAIIVLRSTRASALLRDLLAISWAGSMLEEFSLKEKG